MTSEAKSGQRPGFVASCNGFVLKYLYNYPHNIVILLLVHRTSAAFC